MIKNIHIITGLEAGGAEMMLYKTVSNLDKSKYETIVVSLLSEGPVSKLLKERKIDVYHLNMNKSPVSVLLTFIKLVNLIKKIEPDIIHSYMYHADIMSRIAGKMNSVPIIISSIRNENIGGYFRELTFRYTDFMVSATTAVCKKAADVQIEKKSIKKNKTKVIYNGIELKNYKKEHIKKNTIKKELNIPDEHKVIITVGRIDVQKNQELLIESFINLIKINNNITLLIVGEGPLEEYLKEKVDLLGINKNVIFTGVRKDIKNLMDISDLFVLTSTWEGMPNVLLEAMAMKLPIISTNVGGVSEVIDESHSILVELSNDLQQKITTSMNKMLDLSDKERRDMTRLGYEKVETYFSIEQTIKQTESLYKVLLKKYKEK